MEKNKNKRIKIFKEDLLKKMKITKELVKNNLKEIKQIKAIYCAIDNKKQKRIKKIVKRLNEMSPQDVFMLARILKV